MKNNKLITFLLIAVVVLLTAGIAGAQYKGQLNLRGINLFVYESAYFATDFVFEGSTDDGYETTLAIADPAADATATLTNQTGNIVTGLYGQVSIASGATSGSVTLTGTDTTDYVIATITSGNVSSRSVLTATPTANTVTVTLTGTPGATTTIDVLVIKR